MDDQNKSHKNTLFLILTLLFAPAKSVDSRSVNLALETSFLFDPQDIKENATFIYKVQNVLDKLKSVLDPKGVSQKPVLRQNDEGTPLNKNANHNGTEEFDKIVLTKFLSEIGSAILKFEDEDVKKFSKDLKEAVYKLSEKNKFDALFEDDRLVNFILNSVRIWSESEPIKLKLEIAKYIINVDADSVVELFKILNRVFDNTDEQKFKKLLKKFKKSFKNNDYTNFLIKAIEFVVFKRYKRQNFLLKLIIKEELKKFTSYISKNYSDRVKEPSNKKQLELARIERITKEGKEQETSDISGKGNESKNRT